ncbi:hypothetical protein [Methyloglobulus sp.]|uniref:hypothetical protein n=1 Tax=Methyloglobulus sp. TaxID=2518622 RepID=UPI003988F434
MLTQPIAPQGFKPSAGRTFQKLQAGGALFNSVNFRSATVWIALKRFGEPPSNNAWVSLQRKDFIMTDSILRLA